MRLARPLQWSKNFFCYAAVFFGGELGDPARFWHATLVAMAFCFLSAAVYAINDSADAERDRLHPTKSSRPVASGRFTAGEALGLAAVWCVIAFLLVGFLPAPVAVAGWLAAYLILNVGYTLFFKKLLVVDVGVLAFGFVIRVFAGGAAVKIVPTSWIIICTYGLAAMLAFGKRRGDLVLLNDGDTPAGSSGYTLRLLDNIVPVVAILTAVSYGLYCSNRGEPLLIFTVVPVAAGFYRYLRLVSLGYLVNRPEILLIRDPVIAGGVVLWAVLYTLVIYW